MTRWRTTPLATARPVEPSRNGSRPAYYEDDGSATVAASIDELTREIKVGLKAIAECIDELTTTLEVLAEDQARDRAS